MITVVWMSFIASLLDMEYNIKLPHIHRLNVNIYGTDGTKWPFVFWCVFKPSFNMVHSQF